MPLAVDVLFPLPVPPFRFLAPFDQVPGPVGARVVAPWQGSVRIGLVVGTEEIPAARATEYRDLIAWLDGTPFLATGAAELILELAHSSGAPAGVVLSTMVPIGLREPLLHEVRSVGGADSIGLPAGEWIRGDALGSDELDLYRRQGMVHERVRIVERTASRLVPTREPDAKLSGRAQANQLVALNRLWELGSSASAAELARDAEVPAGAVRSLVTKGYAEYRELPAPPPALRSPDLVDPPLEPIGGVLPSDPVVLITGGLRRDRLATLLLTLEEDLAAGGSVLVLAPEGAFLTEAAGLLAGRLPVLAFTSDLNDEGRSRLWEEAASGRPLVLVGTYPALFAPLPNPARIVVLEAASAAYKLAAGPRLFIPDAARRLARLAGIPLVLSDVLASPEMRVWAAALPPRRAGPAHVTFAQAAPAQAAPAHAAFGQVELPQASQRLFVSDLGSAHGWPLGSDLALVLRQVQSRERQAILLAPRRGFSAAMSCSACGHTIGCPNCDLALRYHRNRQRLKCHQCGYDTVPPEACPSCGNVDLAPGRAAGTEWVAGAVARLLPGFEVARFDRDHQDDLGPLRDGAPGVLVGTTGLFRLPPLPRVSLVGVTLLDTHLNLSDFRAAEEALRLLLQLPELSPGARPLVVVQTFQPTHEALEALLEEDVELAIASYGERVLERRERFRYPPFGQLAKVQVSSRERAAAEREAGRLRSTLLTTGAAEDDVLGPVPAPIARVRGLYSYLVYVRGDDEARFHDLLRGIPGSSGSVKVRLDVDPRDVSEFLE